MKPRSPSLAATGAACALLLLTLLGLAAQLTDGFNHWTFEERRRQQAIVARLQATSPLLIRTSDGQQLQLFDGENAVYLVDFIYTRCPTVCQVLGAEYFQMQQALRAAPPSRVKLVSLSFDGLHDRQAELFDYARQHRADAARWTVAAPVSAATSQQLLQQLGVVAVSDGFGGFVHNGAIHLIDGHGRVRQIFDYADWQSALLAAQNLARS